jgi:serine/threonine protein kinase
MKKCSHPNVVELKEVLDDMKSNKIYLVLEYLERGEIVWQNDDGTARMTLEEVREVARDVTSGLEYLHFQGIIHRDIKPANLLRDKSGKVKISDFGVSYASSLDSTNNEFELAKTAGTPAFYAPELCVSTTNEERPPIDHKIDIWAFGVTLYCMLFGRVPFIADTELHLLEAIVNEPLTFPHTEQLSPLSSVSSLDNSTGLYNDALQILSYEDSQMQMAKDLLSHLLEKDPRKRYDVNDIKNHPWILKGMDQNGVNLFLTKTKEEQKIYVTSEEVQSAVLGITGRIKRGLSKLGSHALHLTGFIRKGTSSSASSRSSSIDRSSSRHRQEPLPIRHEFNSSVSVCGMDSSSSSVSSLVSLSHSPFRNLNQISDTVLPITLTPPNTHSTSTTTTNRSNRALSQSSVLSNDYVPTPLSRHPSSSDSEDLSIVSSSPHRDVNNKKLPLSNNSLNINALLREEDDYDIEDLPADLSTHSSVIYKASFSQPNRTGGNFMNGSSCNSLYTTKSSSSSSSSSSSDGELRITVGPRGNHTHASLKSTRETRFSEGNMRRPVSAFGRNQGGAGGDPSSLSANASLQQHSRVKESTDTLVVNGSTQITFQHERSSNSNGTSSSTLPRIRSRSVTVGEVQHLREMGEGESELAAKRQEL